VFVFHPENPFIRVILFKDTPIGGQNMRYKSLTCTIAMSVGLLTTPLALADLKDGLVAHYPFDGNAQDASGNGNNGTVKGATLTEDRFGNADSAYYFNGKGNNTDSIKLPHTIVDGLIDVTSSIWIQTNDVEQAILNGANRTSDNQYLIHIHNTLRPYIKSASLQTVSVSDGQWHHIVIVRTGNSGLVETFVDGNLVGSGTLPTGALSIDVNGLWIGREQDCLSGCFERHQDFRGVIDDIRIYNRALSEDEIQTLYVGNGDCVHATYSLKKRTLTVPFVEMPVIDFLTGQPTGKMELWTGSLRQIFGTTNRFRLLNKTVAQITDGSSSGCPATYAVETGTLSIPYIDVPTGIAVGHKEFENGVEVFKATMTWEPMGRSFVVQEVEQLP
jgi:hypothetical protein